MKKKGDSLSGLLELAFVIILLYLAINYFELMPVIISILNITVFALNSPITLGTLIIENITIGMLIGIGTIIWLLSKILSGE